MCGRYALTLPPAAVRAYFAYREQPNFPPRYNIAPTQPIALVRRQDGARQFALARWGFLPGFVRDMREFPLILNARAEGIADKPSFRAAIRRRRCLIPADGYYEWQRAGRFKRPFLIRRPNRGPIAFAGLWETFHSPDGSEMDTACIITTAANATIAAVHERMPVVIEPGDFDLWLDPGSSGGDVLALLRPAPDDALELLPVSDAVNRATTEGPEVQEPA
ncbi:MAG TPA: SOS response-associated peptidase [Beijerinckiaceae bacterium]|nr:SOS response-associated peptidase [Beijerinckiaceae bacterium]